MHTKTVTTLYGIAAFKEYCVLATKSDDSSGQFALLVCNSIATPVDSKFLTNHYVT